MKKTTTILKMVVLLLIMCLSKAITAQIFVHPGGLHNQADLRPEYTNIQLPKSPGKYFQNGLVKIGGKIYFNAIFGMPTGKMSWARLK